MYANQMLTTLLQISIPFVIVSTTAIIPPSGELNMYILGTILDRYGPRNSSFGFALAQHFNKGRPVLVVGAPRAEPNSVQSCSQLQIEYPTEEEFRDPPQRLNSKPLHSEGKNNQLLGFVVQSTGVKDGAAMVCAPLLRYSRQAYTDGVCYLLNNELNHTGIISTCSPLPKKDRHNDYGACEQGFSGFIDKNVILTGLPGARKWTGGVFSRYEFTSNGFPDTVDRWTMEVPKEQNGIINILASHDYLGYSVRYGRFGFWYEEANGSNFTIVSGATRYQQSGAVVFLPFRKNSHPEEERLLGLEDDNFVIVGEQLGSGFGYALEVLDLNADGFDDLIVGAPFEFHYEEDVEFGGAVYVFYSNGKSQPRGSNANVFRKPIILRVQGAHFQFGAALTKLGNLDNDPNGYQDLAIGAPQADDGRGAVYIYSGAEPESMSKTPSQVIKAKYLSRDLLKGQKAISGFGSALVGGVDMDGNNYGELAVGASHSDSVVMFRTRPVVDVVLDNLFPQKHVKIDGVGKACPANSQTCFSVITTIGVENRNNTGDLMNFREEPFNCLLQIIPFAKGVQTRALFVDSNKASKSWPCGRNSLSYTQETTHQVHVPKNNQDWTNPLRFNFTVSMKERRSADLVPIINPKLSEHVFDVSFDKKCGDDNDCHTDLSLSAMLLNMTMRDGQTYITKVTERDSIVIRFIIENKRERAFLAKLFLTFNQDELDLPHLINKASSSVDIERTKNGMAVIALGNPLEEQKKLTFDLSFNLVRGSSERVSASLVFDALVNSSSIEDVPADNSWKAELQLIKEADLQLEGASSPFIVRFSKGNKVVVDEEDIGSQVVHVYTLTNHGPFYARNVTVTINWPLKLNTEFGDHWVLYTLEDPVIRHNGELRKCKIDPALKAINPLDVYNDETQKLTYEPTSEQHRIRKPRSVPNRKSDASKVIESQKLASILDSKYIRPKDVEETPGSNVRIIDVNCKDASAVCFPLVCHFDYIGTGDAALIEIRSRLWNYTFSGDYRGIEYIAITSEGFAEVDLAQGILEDVKNNFAKVTTHAYPDRPLQEDRLDLWILLLAVLTGLLLLSILVIICWRCGFFKRKRRPDLHLHQANYRHQLEQYSET
ncbi:integrin alpha domain-containing protein [Ditylenchus destructor]|nr:integrin alpha domain-containing protein [Ditylenchus destructor]